MTQVFVFWRGFIWVQSQGVGVSLSVLEEVEVVVWSGLKAFVLVVVEVVVEVVEVVVVVVVWFCSDCCCRRSLIFLNHLLHL